MNAAGEDETVVSFALLSRIMDLLEDKMKRYRYEVL